MLNNRVFVEWFVKHKVMVFPLPFFITCKVANKDKQNNSPNLFCKPSRTTCITLLQCCLQHKDSMGHESWKRRNLTPIFTTKSHRKHKNHKNGAHTKQSQSKDTHAITKHNGYFVRQSTYLQTKPTDVPFATIAVFSCSIVAQSSTPKALCSDAPHLHMSH